MSEFLKQFLFMRNLRAEKYLRDSSATHIKNLADKELANVRQVLEQGLIHGQNPLQTALDMVGRIDPITKQRVGGVIGLSDYDFALVDTATHYLEQLDKRYLHLKLRDRRFDRTVKRSIEAAKPIPQELIGRIITAYSNKVLRRRGEIIARTEILKSVGYAAYVANKKLIDDGIISPNAMTKEWDDCGDKRVRRSHAIMAQKYGNGAGIPIDEPFILPSGAKMLYPGDASLGAPAKEIIQCRCRAFYNVDWRYGVE